MTRGHSRAISACDEVIEALQAQLGIAHELRERLEAGIPPDAAAVGLCEELWNGAIGAAHAIVRLDEEVCEQETAAASPARRGAARR